MTCNAGSRAGIEAGANAGFAGLEAHSTIATPLSLRLSSTVSAPRS